MFDVSTFINADIWFEILQKLPVKSLGKCRCVCKSWDALVVSPSFMAAHLKHYTQNDSNSLLLHRVLVDMYSRPGGCGMHERYDFYRDSTRMKEETSSRRLHTSICPYPPQLSRDWIPCFHLIGSINGLLCMFDHISVGGEDRVLIWNPLLHKSIVLLKARASSDRPMWGFGYNCRNGDHKLVKLTTFTPSVEIYSVQERTWTTISAHYLVQNSITRVSRLTIFLNGVIHWITFESEPFRAKQLLMFNVAEETFDKMELPETLANKAIPWEPEIGVLEYQSKLSVSHCWDDRSSLSCELWSNAGNNSWFKVLHVTVSDCSLTGPIQTIKRSDELLGFAMRDTHELGSYDPKTKQTKRLGLFPNPNYATRFSSYSESLVLLDYNIDMINVVKV